MRILALAAAAALASGTAAAAAPASVSVTVGPELQHKAETNYGTRDVQQLADHLKASVERALARTGAYPDSRVELVLTDAVPNRPTFKQLGDTPGLSFHSFGVGGAAIEGQVVAADGAVTPVAYRWYETDIRWAPSNYTWGDAEWTLQRFAYRLSSGDKLAVR
jgi:hypothetical protein